MININELRIGNWVEHDGKGLKIESLSSKGYINDPIKIDETMKLIITESSIDPIPITKEIVEKIGFKKVNDRLYEYKMNRDVPFSEKLYVRIFDNDEYKNWACVRPPVDEWEIGAASSFHELQNLFYSITREELIGPYSLLVKDYLTWIIKHRKDL